MRSVCAPAPIERVPPALLAATAFLTSFSPLATDLYLPSMPQMASAFGVGASDAEMTLAVFLAGAALGQLLLGALSDRFGRRTPLLISATACCVASLIAATAPSLAVLVAARSIQGASGAGGMVISRAIIADIATGVGAARALSLMMSLTGIAPIVAPSVGGVLAAWLGWRGVLTVVFVLSVLILVVAAIVIPETHPAERRGRLRSLATPRISVLPDSRRSLQFAGLVVVSAFGFAAILAYVSSSAFLYERFIGVTAAQFGLIFAGNSVILVGATFTSARVANAWPPRHQMLVGILVMTVAVGLLATVTVVRASDIVLALLLPLMLAGFGLMQGPAVALAMGAVPSQAGAASAVVGFAQCALGGASSAVVGIGRHDPAVSLSIVLIVCVAMINAGVLASRSPAARAGTAPAPQYLPPEAPTSHSSRLQWLALDDIANEEDCPGLSGNIGDDPGAGRRYE